jgi:HEAT repeat protein
MTLPTALKPSNVKPRKKIWLLRLGALACVLAAGWWIYSRLYPEQTYQGKAMSWWFKQSCLSGEFMQGSYDWDAHRDYIAAFKAMGTNAVPFLVEQAFDFHQESKVRSNLTRFLDNLPPSLHLPRPIPSRTRNNEATYLLQEMKPPTAQLLALMQKRLKTTNLHENRQVLYILGTCGDGAAQAVPYLTAALQNTNDNWARRLAIQSLGWIGPQAQASAPDLIKVMQEPPGTNHLGANAAVALGNIGGPLAAPGVPYVKKLFEQEKNWNARGNLGAALMHLDPTQTQVLDFLMDGVANYQITNQRWIAAEYLGRIGPAARPAIPVLLKAFEQTNDMLITQIPKALTNMGVAVEVFLPALKAQLKSIDETRRANVAARVLELVPADPDARQALMKSIAAGSLHKEFEIEALGDAGPAAAEALPLLRKIAKESDDSETRDKALRAIKKIEGPPR